MPKLPDVPLPSTFQEWLLLTAALAVFISIFAFLFGPAILYRMKKTLTEGQDNEEDEPSVSGPIKIHGSAKANNIYQGLSIESRVKKVSERPGFTFKDIVIDEASNIAYLLGIIIIELYLKPMFGDEGIPLIPNSILIVSELYLLIKLLWKLFKVIDAFAEDIFKSNIYMKFKNKAVSTDQIRYVDGRIGYDEMRTESHGGDEIEENVGQ